tara:strand:+ start:965 stop:2137 length:1173 start_codon:yes stop_codon:yes gene_type:complete
MRKKIALIGNMNNVHYTLMRYLSDRLFDCTLLLFNNEFSHFYPDSDTYARDRFDKIKKLDWGSPKSFKSTHQNKIIDDLKPYDFLIGNGYTPAYLAKASKKLDIFDPYGSDLYEATIYGIKRFLIQNNVLTFFQRKGIYESKYIHLPKTNPIYDMRVEKLSPHSEKITCFYPLLYLPEYLESNVNFKNYTSQNIEKLIKLKKNNFIYFSQSRHYWKNKSKKDPNNKGNDKLIYAWKKFINEHRPDAILVLFEYGNDLLASKKLIRDLNLDETIIWMPLSPRKEIMKMISFVDVVMGELIHSWFVGGLSMEAISMGKTLITYRDEGYISNFYKDKYPILNAYSTDEIYNKIVFTYQNKNEILKIGDLSKKWYKENVINSFITTYQKIINKN